MLLRLRRRPVCCADTARMRAEEKEFASRVKRAHRAAMAGAMSGIQLFRLDDLSVPRMRPMLGRRDADRFGWHRDGSGRSRSHRFRGSSDDRGVWMRVVRDTFDYTKRRLQFAHTRAAAPSILLHPGSPVPRHNPSVRAGVDAVYALTPGSASGRRTGRRALSWGTPAVRSSDMISAGRPASSACTQTTPSWRRQTFLRSPTGTRDSMRSLAGKSGAGSQILAFEPSTDARIRNLTRCPANESPVWEQPLRKRTIWHVPRPRPARARRAGEKLGETDSARACHDRALALIVDHTMAVTLQPANLASGARAFRILGKS